MQGYFKEKVRTHLDLLSIDPPVKGIFRWYRCRRDPGYVQYHRNNDMLSSSGHTNVKVGSEAAITELLHGIGSTVYIIVTLIVM